MVLEENWCAPFLNAASFIFVLLLLIVCSHLSKLLSLDTHPTSFQCMYCKKLKRSSVVLKDVLYTVLSNNIWFCDCTWKLFFFFVIIWLKASFRLMRIRFFNLLKLPLVLSISRSFSVFAFSNCSPVWSFSGFSSSKRMFVVSMNEITFPLCLGEYFRGINSKTDKTCWLSESLSWSSWFWTGLSWVLWFQNDKTLSLCTRVWRSLWLKMWFQIFKHNWQNT